MESSTLVEKVAEELLVLESIYADDNVVAKPAQISEKNPDIAECQFRFTPNTGFDQARISVIVIAKFEFSPKVGQHTIFTYFFQYPFEPPQFMIEHVKGLDDDQIDNVFKAIKKE